MFAFVGGDRLAMPKWCAEASSNFSKIHALVGRVVPWSSTLHFDFIGILVACGRFMNGASLSFAARRQDTVVRLGRNMLPEMAVNITPRRASRWKGELVLRRSRQPPASGPASCGCAPGPPTPLVESQTVEAPAPPRHVLLVAERPSSRVGTCARSCIFRTQNRCHRQLMTLQFVLSPPIHKASRSYCRVREPSCDAGLQLVKADSCQHR